MTKDRVLNKVDKTLPRSLKGCYSEQSMNDFKKEPRISTHNRQLSIAVEEEKSVLMSVHSCDSVSPIGSIEQSIPLRRCSSAGQTSYGNSFSSFTNDSNILISESDNLESWYAKHSGTVSANFGDSYEDYRNIASNYGTYIPNSCRADETSNYNISGRCEDIRNEISFDFFSSSNTSSCPAIAAEQNKECNLDIQHYNWASSVVENALMNFNATTFTYFGTNNIVSNIELIISGTSYLFRFCEQARDYESLAMRTNQFCTWVLPLLSSLSVMLSPDGCRSIMWIFYTSMRTFFLNSQISQSLVAIFKQREAITNICVKCSKDIPSHLQRDYLSPDWICTTENNLISHSDKLLRIMFIFADIMSLRELCNETTTMTTISEIDKQIGILQSEFEAEESQKGNEEIIDFHWVADYLLLDSAVILLRRITISFTPSDIISVSKADHILKLALLIKKANYQKPSYYYMWPISLVLAAIELEDEVKRDWIQTFLSDTIQKQSYCSESLLEFVKEACQRQSNNLKTKIDIFQIIRDNKIEIFV